MSVTGLPGAKCYINGVRHIQLMCVKCLTGLLALFVGCLKVCAPYHPRPDETIVPLCRVLVGDVVKLKFSHPGKASYWTEELLVVDIHRKPFKELVKDILQAYNRKASPSPSFAFAVVDKNGNKRFMSLVGCMKVSMFSQSVFDKKFQFIAQRPMLSDLSGEYDDRHPYVKFCDDLKEAAWKDADWRDSTLTSWANLSPLWNRHHQVPIWNKIRETVSKRRPDNSALQTTVKRHR